MFLIAGLGNPGPEHERQRHNIGFMAANEIQRRHGLGPFRSKFHGLVAEGRMGGEKVLLLKPMTYMNESGRAVGEAYRYYKLSPDQLVVIYDEIDLAAGKVRAKRGGGTAGHNGLRSIQAHLGTADFRRVRLGIGHPGDKARVTGHVLGDFAKADKAWVERLLAAVADATPHLVAGDDNRFTTNVSQAMHDGAGPRTAAKDRPKQAARADKSGTEQTAGRTAMGAALDAVLSRWRKS